MSIKQIGTETVNYFFWARIIKLASIIISEKNVNFGCNERFEI